MAKYFLANLYRGLEDNGRYADRTIEDIIIGNIMLPTTHFIDSILIINGKNAREHWAGFCSIVGVASMAAAASVVGYLGYHNAEQLCSKVLSMVFEGMDIPAQVLSSTAVASTVLACVAAAWTSCIVMQNLVGAVVAAFVLEPEAPVVYVSMV